MNTILFDLDGTLLPMDMNAFMELYFTELSYAFKDLIKGDELGKNIWASTKAMVENVEDRTNEEVFMEDFGSRVNGDIEEYQKRFDEFYDTRFLNVKSSVCESEYIIKSIALLKEKGYNLVVATNPLFPRKAILHRIQWAGLKSEDFSYISSYEKNHYCKPQIKFYEEILKDIGKETDDCMMVGNDVQEDLIAGKLGMKTYLIKDHLLHRTKEEIKTDYEGSYEEFYQYVCSLPKIN